MVSVASANQLILHGPIHASSYLYSLLEGFVKATRWKRGLRGYSPHCNFLRPVDMSKSCASRLEYPLISGVSAGFGSYCSRS